MGEKKDKDIITKAAESPAQLLEKTLDTTEDIGRHLNLQETVKKTQDYWHTLGPGLTTGAADDDPSGIATYSQTGAQYGLQLLWMAIFMFPFMAVIQEMCARIGLVTGQGLAANIRTHFSKKIVYTIALFLFVANAFNIGADLGAMAKAVQLLQPAWNFSLLVIAFTLISFSLQIFTPYARYAKYLKWLAMILFAYVASAFLAHLNWGDIARHAIIPHVTFSKDQILIICGVIGTTISPYLFFWQTSQEVEERILEGKTTIKARREVTRRAIRNMRLDIWVGMALSDLVTFFIIATCGVLLFAHGITNITSAAQAAEALRPFAGNQSYLLFALGIIGTGLLALPVLAGASSYAAAESFRWHEGLYRKLHQAYAFYGVIIISMLVGLAMNFIGLDPIKALIYSAVLNGIVAPIVLVPILLLSNDQKIMGNWVNKPFATIVGWCVIALMTLSGVGAIISLF